MLGSTARTDVLAREWDPDIVLFVGGAVNSAREMRRAAWSLESSGARIMLVPSLTEVAGDRIQVRPAAGLPMMELQGPASRGTSAALKRAFDVVGPSAALVLASPVLLMTAVAIKTHDGGRCSIGRPARDATAASSAATSSAQWWLTPRRHFPPWPTSTARTTCSSRAGPIRGSRDRVDSSVAIPSMSSATRASPRVAWRYSAIKPPRHPRTSTVNHLRPPNRTIAISVRGANSRPFATAE